MADVNANIGVNIDTSDALNQLKNLQRQISQFHQSVAKSSSTAAVAQRDLQKNFVNSVNAIQGFSAELRTVRTSAESFTNSLEKNKFSMREYFRYAAGATKTFGKNFASEFSTIEKTAIERVKTLQTQYIKMGRDAQGAMQAIAVRPTVLDMKDLGTQTAIAAQKQVLFNQLVKQGSTNLLNFGKNTQWAGRQLMVGFTLPLATLGMTAGRVFMDMEKAAIKFKKVYGDLFTAPEETQKAMDSITELGLSYTKYGVAVADSLSVAADAAAAGFQGVDLQNQTTASLKLSVLGQMELQKALETTIALQNAFRISSEELVGTIDFLNAVENQTVVSLEDITEATPRVATVIQALGGDVKDLAFFLAAMKEGGVNAAQGANALKSGLASLINPTERASELLLGMGVNIRAIVSDNQGDLRGTVLGFARALDSLDPMRRAQAIEQLFGKFQFARISALFDNVIREGSQASRVLDLAGSSLSDLAALSEKELGTQAASSMNKFTSAIERIKVALVPLGQLFLDIATPFVDFGTKLLEAFNNLPDGVRKAIGTVITVVGGIGPVLLMTFGLINNGIANMIKFFATVRLGYLKMTGQAKGIGDETQYMTQEQLEAAAAAASLDQAHSNLTQRFTAEKTAVDALRDAYTQAAAAGARFAMNYPGMMKPGFGTPTKMAKGGVVTVGGRGNKDTEPALLTPGEAVIPAEMVKKYQPLIQGMIAGNIPGYSKGFLGMPKTSKGVSKHRDAAQQVYEMFLKSSYANTAPTEYGHQISPTSGHSFPIFGLGGVYQKGNKQVFVKPVLDEKAALAEMRSTEISRRAHGLEAPEQRIVVIRDPLDTTRQRRFLALESDLDPKFVNNQPMGVFNEEQYFRQLVASLLRVDKDLSGANVYGNVVADAGPAGVFSRASGLRDYEKNLPSMEEQAIVNLLGIKGGAKRAFAESTLGLMAGLTPEQYKQRMLGEIQKVLPRLKETIASFKLTNPTEVGVYDDMVRRLESGLGVDWSKFHAIHSKVKPAKPKVKTQAAPGYKDGVVSVPGPKGAGDVVAAMLAPGEAVIPAAMAKKYAPLIQGMIAGSIPGYEGGVVLSPTGQQFSEKYETATDRKSQTVPKGRAKINAQLPGRGEEAQAVIANAGVSTKAAMRLMAQLADAAADGAESFEATLSKLKELIQKAKKQKSDANLIKDSETLKKDLRSEMGYVSKNTRTSTQDFAHIGSGASITVGELLKKIQSGEVKGTSESDVIKLQKILSDRGEEFLVDIKTGLGIQGIEHGTNVALDTTGADIDQFKKEFDAAGIEKWNKSIEFGGGNVEEFASQTALLDAELSRLISAVEKGTLVFDTEAKAAEARASGKKAVSVESLYAQGRENVKTQAPELIKSLDTAQSTGAQLRSSYGGLNTGGSLVNRGSISELQAQAQKEQSLATPAKLGKEDQEAYDKAALAATTPSSDPFVKSVDEGNRGSPHKDAAKLGKQDQEAYNKAAQSAKSQGKEALATQAGNNAVAGASNQIAPAMRQEATASRTFAGDLKASFTNARANITREMGFVKEELGAAIQQIKEKFSKGGVELAAVAQKTNQGLIVNGKDYGFNAIAQAQGRDGAIEAIVTRKNAEIIAKATEAYNAGTIQIPRVIKDGIKSQESVLNFGGENIAQVIVASMRKKTAELAGGLSLGKGETLALGMRSVPEGPAEDPAAREARISAKATASLQNFQKASNQLSAFSFAISSATGVASAFGLDLSGVMPVISGLTGALFALTMVTSQLTQTKIAEQFFTAKAQAGGLAPLITQLKGGATGLAGFRNVIGKVFGALSKAAPILSRLIPILGLVGTVGFFVVKLYQEQKDKMEAFGKIVDITADQIKYLGDQAGQDVVTETGFGRAFLSDQAEVSSQKAKDRANDEEFIEQFNQQITAASKGAAADVQEALRLVAYQLSSAGLGEQVVQETIAGIIRASKRTDIAFDFNNVKVSEENTDAIIQGIKDRVSNAPIQVRVEPEPVTPTTSSGYITNPNQGTTYTPMGAPGRGAAALGAQDVADNAKAAASAMQSFGLQLEKNTIDIEQYTAGIDEIASSLSGLNEKSRGDAANTMIDTLFPEEDQKGLRDMLKDIDDVDMRFELIKLASIDTGDAFKKYANMAKTSGINSTNFKKVIDSVIPSLHEEHQALIDINEVKTATSALDTDLKGQIEDLEKQRDAFNNLRAAGIPAADAVKLLGNANLLAAASAGPLSEETMALVRDLLAIEKEVDSLGGSGAGGGQKSPFQEATERLKTQRTEIKNSIKAYAGLRKANVDVARAAEIAGDSLFAAALASKEVGSKEWKKLYKEIERVRKAENKWKNTTLDGKTAQFNEVYDKVSEIFSAQEAILEANNESATKTNRTLIESLEAQIEGYERQISTFQRDLDKIAEKEDEINKTYDKKVDALEAVKKLNQDIINQQKSQLSIADALSQGDIAAAASAMQDSRAQNAAAQGDATRNALDIARQSQLNALKENGLTRAEIEAKIKTLKGQISTIEFGSLQTARDAVEAADRALEKAKGSLTVNGLTKTAWDVQKASIDVATTRAGLYKKEADKALASVKGITSEWNSLNGRVITTYYQSLPASEKGKTPKGKADGGYISGPGTATSDSIPALLSNGEYVIKAASVSKFGKNFLDAINAGNLPGFKKGGAVLGSISSKAISALANPAQFNKPVYNMPEREYANLGASGFGVSTSRGAESSTAVDNSVYNYNLSVNVDGTNATPEQIANVVMRKIQSVGSQRLRGQVVR
jgi:TP901 family phage tail tape measure protein